MNLGEEKEKALYCHRLEIRRIWLEKLLVAALIGIAGFVGNLVFENYRSELTRTQFLLENRLQALKAIRDSYSVLATHAYLKATNDGSASAVDYTKAVQSFMNTVNEWGFLFSRNFDRELTHHAWLHQYMADPQTGVSLREHWGFIFDLAQAFDVATRTAMSVEVLGVPRDVPKRQFYLRMWGAEDVQAKGTRGVFVDNLDKWQKERARSP